jgi:hypothetical protein
VHFAAAQAITAYKRLVSTDTHDLDWIHTF